MSLVITFGYGSYGPTTMQQTTAPWGFGGIVDDTPPVLMCPASFWLDSTEIPASNVVRARFTDSVLVLTGSNANRGDIAANYTLTGPEVRTITMASPVSTDAEVIDLYLDQDLIPGIWTLTVASTLFTADGHVIQAPLIYVFNVVDIQQDPLPNGGQNSSAEEDVLALFNPTYRDKKNWRAVMAGIATGTQLIRDMAEKAFNQMYLASAVSKYLTTRAADQGIARPNNVGIPDEFFRALAIQVSTRKLTQQSFLGVLEILYGPDATRGFVESNLAEPYTLLDGSNLTVVIDGVETAVVEFDRPGFQILRRARALEAAAVITQALQKYGSKAYAVQHVNPATGATHVRIYSGSTGIKSSVQVVLGTAQPALEFQRRLDGSATAASLPQWDITVPTPGVTRYAPQDQIAYNLSGVVAGDYVTINGAEFNAANRGTFPITNVQYAFTQPGGDLDQWFEVSNAGHVENIQQCRPYSIEIFRPERRIPYDNPAHVSVSQKNGAALVEIPATTQVVSRAEYTGAYVHRSPLLNISALTREPGGATTLTTATAHGLAPDKWFEIEGFYPDAPAAAPVTPGTPSAPFASSDIQTGTSSTGVGTRLDLDTTTNGVLGAYVADTAGQVWVLGGEHEAAGTPTLVGGAAVFQAGAGGPTEYPYTWTRKSSIAGYTPSLGIAATCILSGADEGQILAAGGYTGSPWADQSSAGTLTTTARLSTNPAREPVLVAGQLSDSQGILSALAYYMVANPVSGDTLHVSDGTTTRVYGFGTGGDVTVTIGGSPSATMVNLAAGINGDGSAAWGATKMTPFQTFSNIGAVVIYEDAVTASKSGLRVWGVFGTQANHKSAIYASATVARPDYSVVNAVTGTIGNTMPSAGQAGFHRAVADLLDGERHLVYDTGVDEFWDAGGSDWSLTGRYVISASGGTLPTGRADAGLTFMTAAVKGLIAGGITTPNVPTTAVTQWASDTWTAKTALAQARSHAAVVPISDTRALVIGGRSPAVDNRAALGFTNWTFDDGFLATNYAGPVTVPRGSNPQPVGKMGYAARTTAPMVASAGSPQTALNAALLGDYTITGWMTSKPGCVFYNGVATHSGVNDNTLISFGSLPSGNWAVTWHDSTGTLRSFGITGLTVDMPIPHSNTAPRYYHFALTKKTGVGNATFVLYLNGRPRFTGTFVNPPTDGTNGVWHFGSAYAYNSQVAYTGNVDQVGITATVLTAAQVFALYSDELGVAYDHPSNMDLAPMGRVLSTCELLDPTTGRVGNTGSMFYARFAAGVAVLPDGRILVAGGLGYNPSQTTPPVTSQRHWELRSVEIYDPTTGTWSPGPDMAEPKSYPAIGIIDGAIYVMGGYTSKLVERLDLATMRWGVVATLPNVRARAGGRVATQDILVLAGGSAIADDGTATTADEDAQLIVAPDGVGVYAGGLNGLHRAVTATGSTITFDTPDYPFYTTGSGGTVEPVGALPGKFPGPYIWDTTGGFGITGGDSVTTQRLERGAQYSSVNIGANDALNFPNAPGYLVFSFGYKNQAGPVPYLGCLNGSALIIDSKYRFQADIPAGASVILLHGRGPFVPEHPERLGSFYLTDSPSGRIAAQNLIENISAAGIDLTTTVVYPGRRGLGNDGFPTKGNYKLSDVVVVWGPSNPDAEIADLKEE